MWFTAEDLVRLGIWDPPKMHKFVRLKNQVIGLKTYIYVPPED
jgi:hypothetical protein